MSPTPAAADFCVLTPCIAARRAARAMELLPVRSHEVGQHHLAPGCLGSSTTVSWFVSIVITPHGAQISPNKNVNFPCASAAFTLPPEPMGFVVRCQLARRLGLHYAVSIRHLARLHSGFLQTIPRGLALAFG